ncbi:anthrax toxin-like adenylyl cyclase domain-containing protein, partial [Proteus mirabilis]
MVNYQGVDVDSQENVNFSYNIKYKELFIKNKIKEGGLLTINTATVKGLYSFSDKKLTTMRKVVLLLSDINNLDTHYLNFAQEYHNAGYDLFIVDTSTGIDAGEKAYDYLIKNYNVDVDSILLHGHNKSGENVFDLYHSLNKRGYFPEGIVLSSSNNDLISVLNKINQLNYKTNIYIAYDHQITDENNFLINRVLTSFEHKVRNFSFSQREEYNNFSDAKYHQPDPVRKFSIYQSRNLVLEPIGKEPIPTIGMPENDQKIFSQTAESENVIIGVRPIDTQSTTLIQSKEYSSKGLLIKGKSSDWGPMAGFIPVDQSLAKLSARNNVAKYNLANQEALDKGYAISIPLTLSVARVKELQQNNILKYSDLQSDIIQVTCSVDNKEYHFYLSKVVQEGKVTYTVNYYDNGKLIPINVLADTISKKPMIADYDLFTVMYSYSDLSEKSIIRKAISWDEWKSGVNYDELSPTYQEYYNNKDLYDRYEGEQLGLISQHVKKIKNKLNRLLQREKGKEMIHHGADDANPFSVIMDNFPATFFVPNNLLDKKLNKDNNTLRDFFVVTENNVIIIRNAKEFSNFQQLVINSGFISPVNEKWNDGIEENYFSRRKKSSENYINNRELLESIFSAKNKNKYQTSLNEINNEYLYYISKSIRNNNLKNIINTSSQQANKEIELLISPYNHIEAINKYIDGNGIYNKLSIKLKQRINQYKIDLDWFKKGGHKIFNFIYSNTETYLSRSDSIRLNNIFNIILDLPEIKEPIYKSIYVDNLFAYTKNIDTGSVVAINSVLIGNRNVQKIKQNENNVFISLVGEHNARTMTGISDRFTDQVMIAPGKHFRVVSKRKENNKYYIVLEAIDVLVKSEPIFDLYDASLKGIAIDPHRSTVTESLETVISDKRLLDTINKINNEYIDISIESNFIDKIINKKLTPEYAEYRYYQELSEIFGAGKNYVDMLKKIINDPLSNKKYNQYINNKINREEWLASFTSDYYLNDPLKEKIINVKLLVDTIHDQPSSIGTLSDASKSILMEFFASDFDTLRGNLLKLVSDQESYTRFISTIEKVQFYLTQKNNFKDDSIHDVFYKVNQIETDRQNISHVIFSLKKKLLQSPQNKNKYESFILRLPFDNNSKTSSLLSFLYASLNGKVTHDTLIDHINLLEKLYIKLAYNDLTPQQLEYLSVFNTLLTDISQKEVMNNNMFKIAGGVLNNKISQLSIGNYLLEIDTKRINLNISTTENNRFIYRIFISDVGEINITGSDREQMTIELFRFLNEINNVKNNIAVEHTNETSVSGVVYHVNEEGIISPELFDKLNILKNKISSDISQQNIIKIAGVEIDKAILFDLGCQVDGKSIININLQDIPNWQNKLRFDAEKLNDFFLSASGSEIDHKILSLLKKILANKEKNIKNILSADTSRTDYIVAKERLMKIIELNNSNIDSNYWHKLRNPSLKIPRHMKIISKIGYANIAFGMWQTINSTFMLAEQLNNPQLTLKEQKEIVNNLAIMW